MIASEKKTYTLKMDKQEFALFHKPTDHLEYKYIYYKNEIGDNKGEYYIVQIDNSNILINILELLYNESLYEKYTKNNPSRMQSYMNMIYDIRESIFDL